MAASFATGLLPALTSTATAALAGSPTIAAAEKNFARAKTAGEDFEAVFINNMFQQMFAGVGDGPFSGGPGAGIWRSFLTDEYAKSFVKAGGIGIASEVQRALLGHQEAAQ